MIPNARATPAPRPCRIDVPAMPRVAGPGLAEATMPAPSMRGQFSSSMIGICPGHAVMMAVVNGCILHPTNNKSRHGGARAAFLAGCGSGSSSLRAPSACASACGPGGSIRQLRGRGARTAFHRRGDSSSRGTRLRAAASFSERAAPGRHCCLVRLRTRSITPFGLVFIATAVPCWPEHTLNRKAAMVRTPGAVRDKERVVSYLRPACKARTGFSPHPAAAAVGSRAGASPATRGRCVSLRLEKFSRPATLEGHREV